MSNNSEMKHENSSLVLNIPEQNDLKNSGKDTPILKQPSHYDLDNTPTIINSKQFLDDVDKEETWLSTLIADEDFKQK